MISQTTRPWLLLQLAAAITHVCCGRVLPSLSSSLRGGGGGDGGHSAITTRILTDANTTTTTSSSSSSSSSVVCIVGAGASGLSSYLRLMQTKKYGKDDIIIFEKEAVAGGKAIDYVGPDGKTYIVGPQTGVPKSYHYIDDLLQQFQVR